jgi:hypothetical protein
VQKVRGIGLTAHSQTFGYPAKVIMVSTRSQRANFTFPLSSSRRFGNGFSAQNIADDLTKAGNGIESRALVTVTEEERPS